VAGLSSALEDQPMQILAGSLNVEVGAFLHAGYLSASPQTFQLEGGYHFARSKAKLFDVKKAVELQETKDQGRHTKAGLASPAPTLPAATMVSDVCVLAIAFFFFAYLVSLYYRRMREIAKPGWWPWLLAGMPMLALVLVHYWAWPAFEARSLNSLPPPWKDVPIEEYRDPQAATEAILHTLVANALLGVSVEVQNLAAVQEEVAFPVAAAEYTAGMNYAQKTYGRDGWGREFSFDPLGNLQYRITSAGPDGIPGTKDDVFLVTPKNETGWGNLVGGVYCRIVEGRDVVLIHRVNRENFLPAHFDDARTLTGTDLFDLLGFDEMLRRTFVPEDHEPPIVTELKSRRQLASAQETAGGLLFARFEEERNE
jgi:hypothetical protein